MTSKQEQTQKSDVELIHAIARGDEQAFVLLYNRYNAILFGFLLRILHNHAEAEEVWQEVCLQIWQRACDYNETRGRPFTWLVTLTRSRAIDRLRTLNSHDRIIASAAQDVPESVGNAADDVTRAEQSETVRRSLARIPAAQRRAILLAYFEGLTQPEIAERLKEPLGTVKTRTRAGLMKLRELLRGMTSGQH